MKIDTIILDLDDVLNTCSAAIAKLFGVQLKHPSDLSWFDPDWGYDIVGAVSYALGMPPDNPMKKTEFWDAVPSEFWEHIPKSEACNDIVTLCSALVGDENVIIATSCTKDSMSYGFKHRWMVNNLPGFMHRQFNITPRKARLCVPGTLLIDDCWDNCLAAQKRGGAAICWPKPWNPKRHDHPAGLQYLNRRLRMYDFY